MEAMPQSYKKKEPDDLQPEMIAPAVCDTLIDKNCSCEYDVIIANFANSDMAGHTDAEKAAAEAVVWRKRAYFFPRDHMCCHRAGDQEYPRDRCQKYSVVSVSGDLSRGC